MGKTNYQLSVSKPVYNKLSKLKKELGAKSFNEVIRELIRFYEDNKGLSIWEFF